VVLSVLKYDQIAKSRHSGLSGIGCYCSALKKKDSGQAGMTVLRYYGSFYESVKYRIGKLKECAQLT